jgi:hypothetical protein
MRTHELASDLEYNKADVKMSLAQVVDVDRKDFDS